MFIRQSLPFAGAVALLAACSSPEEPVAAPEAAPSTPAPVLTPAPVPTAAPDGTALVPGRWEVSEDATGARAVFAEEGGSPKLTVACNTATRAVTLTRADVSAVPVMFRLDAGGQAARLDMAPGDGGLTAEIEPSLPIIIAFADESTAIALTGPDGVTQQFPANVGIRRVMQACS